MDYVIFISKVAQEMKLKGLTHADLGKMTGYSKAAIDLFMATGVKTRSRSRKVATALAKALKIEL